MSTNKSQNLNLHLWVPEDDFLRTEFNENFAALDTAVKAEETARQSAVSSAVSAANSAQSTASSALSKANAAYSDSKKPYYYGSYRGNGKTGSANTITLNIGFRPSFIMIMYSNSMIKMLSGTSTEYEGNQMTWSSSGVSFYTTASTSSINQSGVTYSYIAFR